MGLSSSIVGIGIDRVMKAIKICCCEKSELYERSDHPLLNNLILCKVFQHLNGNDLKKCRLVNKTWNMSTIPYTRKEFEVTICRDIHNYWRNRSIENFIDCFSSNELGMPVGRFLLGSFSTTDGVGQKFLQMCGLSITAIKFVDRDQYTVEDISELLRLTPTLETLHIPNQLRSREGNIVKLFPEDPNTRVISLKRLIVKSDFPEERDKFCPTFLEELITAAENISCLDLHDASAYNQRRNHYCDSIDHYGMSSYLQVLSLFEKLGRESCIQELETLFIDREASELIDLLLKMACKPNGLKLRRFLHYTSTNYIDKLIPLLACFKDTLENLKIYTPCSNFMKLTISTMSRLKKLSLYLPDDFNLQLVNFGKIFPVLEELEYEARDQEECDEFFPKAEQCLNMKSLVVYRHRFKINGFNQIVRNFPNLTKLEMSIKSDGVEILRQIWSQLTRLKYLDINGTVETKDSLDSVLTGISTLDVHVIRDALRNINKRKTALERRDTILKLMEEHCRFPSIANLTDLRLLNLALIGEGDRNVGGGNKTYMTDLTGYLGLYSMKRLKCLQLNHCELTKNCWELLIKDMGHLDIWTFGIPKLKCVISSSGNYYISARNGRCYSFKSLIPCLHNTT